MKSRPLGIDRIQVWILSPLAPQCGKYGSLFSAKQHQNIWTDSNEYVVYCTFSLYIKIKSHTHSEAQLKSSLKIFNFILLLIKKKKHCTHNCIDRPHCLRYEILTNIPKAVSAPETTLLQPAGPPGLSINKPHQRTFCCHNTLLPFYWRPSPPVRKCRRHARSTTLLSTMPSIYSLPLGESPPPTTFPPPSLTHFASRRRWCLRSHFTEAHFLPGKAWAVSRRENAFHR